MFEDLFKLGIIRDICKFLNFRIKVQSLLSNFRNMIIADEPNKQILLLCEHIQVALITLFIF